MDIVCIGVYNAWSNSRTKYPTKGVRGGKKYPYAYFTNENGKFWRKRVSKTEAIRLKLHGIFKKRKFICKICSSRFFVISKNFKEKIECPVCK